MNTQIIDGLKYLLSSSIVILTFIYLQYFSYDGEVIAFIFSPLFILAIFYFIYGIKIFFSKEENIKNEIISENENKIVSDAIHEKSFGKKIILLNLFGGGIIFIIGLISINIFRGDWTAIGILILGIMSYGAFTIITIIIYIFGGKVQNTENKSNNVQLKSSNEQLKSSNEQLKSSNEQLRIQKFFKIFILLSIIVLILAIQNYKYKLDHHIESTEVLKERINKEMNEQSNLLKPSSDKKIFDNIHNNEYYKSHTSP